MLEEHDWIHSERQFFGQPNTSYDFKINNPREAGQRLKKLEETTTKLERNVNKRAMNMLNEAEERVRTNTPHGWENKVRSATAFSNSSCLVLLQYNDLMKKKRIVENDKAKILQTIEELDQKKNEALNLAWQKVGCLLFSSFCIRQYDSVNINHLHHHSCPFEPVWCLSIYLWWFYCYFTSHPIPYLCR